MSSDAASTWKRLRLKVDPTADDADWRGTPVTPNRLTAVVGGTTADGVYSITLTGFVKSRHGQSHTINFTATFTRAAAENDDTIADELENDFDAGTINPGSQVTLAQVGITANVSTATITVLFPPEADITVTTSAPVGATITTPIGAVVPITASSPHYGRAGQDSLNSILVMLNQMDDAGVTLLAPGASTISLQAIELCEVETVNSDGSRSYSYRYGGLTTLTLQTFGTPIAVPLRGAKYWTIRLLTDASLDANTDSIEVIYREAAI